MRIRFVAGEIFTGMWRNIAMVISVIIVTAVSLTFVGLGILSQHQISAMKDNLVRESQITVYMCSKHSTAVTCSGAPATDAQQAEVVGALDGPALSEYVDSYTKRSQEQALEIYQRQFAGEGFAQDFTAADMPISYHITLKDPSRSDAVVEYFSGREGVDEVKDLLSAYQPLIDALNQSTLLTVGLAGVMMVAAWLLIGTTIRMSAANRRREVAIMRLVGASNVFIRLPFLLEGAVAALIGSTIASALLWLTTKYVITDWLKPVIGGELVRVGPTDALVIAPFLILIGVGLAVVSSIVSLHRYLKV
ncbi:permease-like cell division protein FtsX [Dermabacteraceae bacterium P7054]